MELRQCTKCKETKTVDSFYKNKTTKDGFSLWCRDCTRKSQKHYRKQNKVKINIRKKEYYEENKVNILQKQKQYNEENKESKIAYKKDWYLNNRTQILLSRKDYREENKELIRIRKKLYREKNQEKIKALKKQYYDQNKDNINERRKLYREENKEKIKAEKKRYYEENKSSIRLRRKNEYQENKDGYIIRSRLNHKKKKKLRTKELNLFYTTNAVPKYLWHENEFAKEEDFQSAIEHIIVNRYGIQIERWTFLEELGVPDIYLPEIDLIIEVKLHSSMWTKESVLEQSQRYSQISDTIVVSLDGMPEYWMYNDDKTNSIFWFNPEQLFKFIYDFKTEHVPKR